MVDGGTMEKNFIELYEKIDKFANKHSWTKDSVATIPYVGDAYTKIIDIANISNKMKLDYAWSCISKNLNIEQSINMIYNYVSDEDRAFYISGEFRKIILSSSLIASSIIAYIMGQVVYGDRKCTHTEILITNALTNMTDYDLDNFIFLCENCVEKLGEYETINVRKVDKEKMDSYKYTMQVLASHGIFSTESAIMSEDSLYEGLHYVKTNLSTELLNYIDTVKQLLQYRSQEI